MASNDRLKPLLTRGANTTLRRAIAAFGLEASRVTLSVETVCDGRVGMLLRYWMDGGGDPFLQRRYLSAQHRSVSRAAADIREAVDEMMFNVALAFRPAHAKPPVGWSIHPVAASVIAAAQTELPNPADPLNWLERVGREIHLPNGGHIADAVFTGREGVLLLQGARIIDARGATVATLGMEGPLMVVRLPGAYPEVYAEALKGRPVDTICTVLAADPRAMQVPIASAASIPTGPPCMVMELADRLIPLLPSTPGGERWRPRTAKRILRSSVPGTFAHYLQHSALMLQRHYARATAAQRRASNAYPKSGPVPRACAGQATNRPNITPVAALLAKLP